jgi:hypothetical protein
MCHVPCIAELKKLDNAAAQQAERLAKSDPKGAAALEARRWIDSNRPPFRGPVFGPVAMDVSVTGALASRAIEAHVAKFMWSAFVVTCQCAPPSKLSPL